MVRLPLWLVVVAILAITSASAGRAQESYLGHIEGTVAGIESGDYNLAAESLRKALALDANESLAHLCLATIYAHAGQPEQAVMQYKVALGLRPDDQLALYGMGVALLGRPDIQGAAAQFRVIKPGSGTDTAPVLAYTRSLSGEYGAAAQQVAALPDLTSAQLRATALFKAGKLPEAREAMMEVAKALPSKGYSERPGAVVTFDPRRPVSFTGKPLAKPIVPPAVEAAAAPRVVGTTRLKADLQRAPNVKFVLFFVNEQMVGLVNHLPYEYNWDTTRFANGLHTVKIQGLTAENQVVNEKSMKIRVDNPGAKPKVLSGVHVDALRARLWDRMKLSPSIAAAHYMLAKCAAADGDREGQAAHLEKVMAVNPDYLDTRALLRQAYGKMEPYRELREGPANGGKKIALTFDDGPNPRTAQLLDTLAKAGVKATFFVVGQMCEEHPEMIERIRREGHEIQNHTYSHRNLKYLPVPEIERELFKTIAVLRDLTGVRAGKFRPPGGHLDANGQKVAADFGLLPVFWTANCSRYEGSTVSTMTNYVSSAATPGGVVLMHNAEDITLGALPAILDSLKSKGYGFVSVSEMFLTR